MSANSGHFVITKCPEFAYVTHYIKILLFYTVAAVYTCYWVIESY